MPNIEYKTPAQETARENYLKVSTFDNKNANLLRKTTFAPSPARTIENLKINIESFPEKPEEPVNSSEIKEESVSIPEISNSTQNKNNDSLTMRYDSVMNKTHKKVGKVQFQSSHESPSETLVLPPVRSAEESIENLKQMPMLIEKIIKKNALLRTNLEGTDHNNDKTGKLRANVK